jgi:hypothetical protein
LLNAVGLGDSVLVDTVFVDLRPGDRLLLCTDGVHGQRPCEAALGEVLRRGNESDAASALVLEVAPSGRDNATAVVVDICERFVAREDSDPGPLSMSLRSIAYSPLFEGLPHASLLSALAAAVEVEYPAGEVIPQAVASDLVTYIVLDGLVSLGGGRLVGMGALLFAESLVEVGVRGLRPVARERARLLRIRGDDFREVCAADPTLGALLFQRVATYLARNTAALTARLDAETASDTSQTTSDLEAPAPKSDDGDAKGRGQSDSR